MTTPFTSQQVDNPFESFFNKIKNGFCQSRDSVVVGAADNNDNDDDDDDDDDNYVVNTHREITILHQVAEPPTGELLLVLTTDTNKTNDPFIMAREQSSFLDAYEIEPITRQRRVNRMMETKIYTIVLVFLTWLTLYQLGYRLEFSIHQSRSSSFPIQLNKRTVSTSIKVPVATSMMEATERQAEMENQQHTEKLTETIEAHEQSITLNTERNAKITVDSSLDESTNEEL